ncbi:AbiV family abortive infection protein [Novosphingobium aerophilum]|uniref:AbiV family abortive infection protein n=1 Tax=Novosphingobium TaxID=165696 RepID=UPI002D77CEF7|nr:AbiV family abortive infection protein [Novosphingobium sp. RL4]WRT94259.1 AbiV family abortive infection protein [Novosphingobium sp. RL4]
MSRKLASPEELAFFKKTIENAERLASDAQLMADNERAPSAMMLSIFAIEELGKALITSWGVKNQANSRPYPTHIEKQAATFALLSAYEMTKISKAKLRRKLAADGFDFTTIGPLSEQFAFARSGFFDDVRMAVTYADQLPKMPLHDVEDGVHVDLASEILGWFRLARRSMFNVSAMEMASVLFENNLGRL